MATTSMNLPSISSTSEATQDPDAEVVSSIQKGNLQSYSKLYNKYLKKIYGYCVQNVGNQQEAEDLAQDVFIEAFKSIHGFEFRSLFRTWLYQIARYQIMDYWRKMYKGKTLALEDFLHLDLSNSAPEVDEQDVKQKEERVQEILEKLPEHYRKILELRFLKSYTLKETASELDITVNNAKVLQYRAIQKAISLS
ncbi:MAG: RNA polymerase sigma factor [Candidatus Kerfeldbacteria bacterium]|nr:RNA polymerase sigma factor [Candidatus Kerfeldbacteria bacterium]